jgi:hypothetical protein
MKKLKNITFDRLLKHFDFYKRHSQTERPRKVKTLKKENNSSIENFVFSIQIFNFISQQEIYLNRARLLD